MPSANQYFSKNQREKQRISELESLNGKLNKENLALTSSLKSLNNIHTNLAKKFESVKSENYDLKSLTYEQNRTISNQEAQIRYLVSELDTMKNDEKNHKMYIKQVETLILQKNGSEPGVLTTSKLLDDKKDLKKQLADAVGSIETLNQENEGFRISLETNLRDFGDKHGQNIDSDLVVMIGSLKSQINVLQKERENILDEKNCLLKTIKSNQEGFEFIKQDVNKLNDDLREKSEYVLQLEQINSELNSKI